MAIKTYQLYNGEVILTFDEEKHLYSVEGRPVYGVTNIVGVLEKPALRWWAVNQAIEYLQENWQPGKEYDEVSIVQMLEQAKYAWRMESGKAKTIGAMAHKWIKEFLQAKVEGKPLPEMPVNVELRNCINAFLKWLTDNKVQLLGAEQVVYSRRWEYAGTLDGDMLVNDKLSVVDFKTANEIYPEYWLQTVAYLMAKKEETGRDYKQALIVRIGKNGELEVRGINDDYIDECFKVFRCCLGIYRWQRALKGREIKVGDNLLSKKL